MSPVDPNENQQDNDTFRILPGSSPLHVRAVMARRGFLIGQLIEDPIQGHEMQGSLRCFMLDLEKWLIAQEAA